MGYSGIGGQAVMEGVMMKNGIHYAVAVRKPDKEIVVDAREYPGIVKNQKIKKNTDLAWCHQFYRFAGTGHADIDVFRFFF